MNEHLHISLSQLSTATHSSRTFEAVWRFKIMITSFCTSSVDPITSSLFAKRTAWEFAVGTKCPIVAFWVSSDEAPGLVSRGSGGNS